MVNPGSNGESPSRESLSAESLSAGQQRLLQRYADGEAGFVSRWRANRLLASSNAANDFLVGLEQLAQDAVLCWPERGTDLWEKIDRRIEQEERSAVYLGSRVPVRESSSIFERFMPGAQQLSWGVGGAAFAGLLFAVLFLPAMNETLNQPSSFSTASNSLSSSGVSGSETLRGDLQDRFRQVSLPDRYFSLGAGSEQGVDSRGAAEVRFASSSVPVRVKKLRSSDEMQVHVRRDEDGGVVMWVEPHSQQSAARERGRRVLILKRRSDSSRVPSYGSNAVIGSGVDSR